MLILKRYWTLALPVSVRQWAIHSFHTRLRKVLTKIDKISYSFRAQYSLIIETHISIVVWGLWPQVLVHIRPFENHLLIVSLSDPLSKFLHHLATTKQAQTLNSNKSLQALSWILLSLMVNKQIWWAAKLYNRVWNSLSGTHMTIKEGMMANKNKLTSTKVSQYETGCLIYLNSNIDIGKRLPTIQTEEENSATFMQSRREFPSSSH